MKLWELFDIEPIDLKKTEFRLNKLTYAPDEKVKKNQPVVKVELPIGNPKAGRPAHFYQRAWERGISPDEILKVMKKGHDEHEKIIDKIAKEENPHDELMFYDQSTHVEIPVITVPNRDCSKTQSGNPVCMTPDGKQPKNKLVAKTVIRKGEQDLRSWTTNRK
jgi:hypothetical protein